MPTFRITPWAHDGELRTLGRLFFRRGALSPDAAALQEGLDTVTAWQHRGPVPHAVAATAGLVAAVVADRRSQSARAAEGGLEEATVESSGDAAREAGGGAAAGGPAYAGDPGPRSAPRFVSFDGRVLCAAYSFAISAFVTGYLDSQQTGAAKRSMFDLAAELGMPGEFVSARHAVVHEDGALSLREARRVGLRGLEWMYERYWKGVSGDGVGATTGDGVADDVRIEVGRVLEEYEAAVAGGEERSPRLDSATGGEAVREARRVLLQVWRRDGGVQALFDILLSEERLCKVRAESYTISATTVSLWQPLLLALAAAVPAFSTRLVEAMMDRICSDSTRASSSVRNVPTSQDDGVALTLVAWLLHVFTAPQWKFLRQAHVMLEDIVERCLANPGLCTGVLMAVLPNTGIWEEQASPELHEQLQREENASHVADSISLQDEVWKMIGDGRVAELLA